MDDQKTKAAGHNIVTVRGVSYTPDGIKHHAVVKYVLRHSSGYSSGGEA